MSVRESTRPCFEIVERLVKPSGEGEPRRLIVRGGGCYGDKRPALYAAIEGLSRALAIAEVSKTVMPAFVPTTD